MALRLTTSKARERFAEILINAGYKRQRVLLERHGKKVAAVVSAEDLELLEALEERTDLEAIREALKEGGEPIPYELLKAKLGL